MDRRDNEDKKDMQKISKEKKESEGLTSKVLLENKKDDDKKFIILKSPINSSSNTRNILVDAANEDGKMLKFIEHKSGPYFLNISSAKVFPTGLPYLNLIPQPYRKSMALSLEPERDELFFDFHSPSLIPKKLAKRKLKRRVAAFKKAHGMFTFTDLNWLKIEQKK